MQQLEQNVQYNHNVQVILSEHINKVVASLKPLKSRINDGNIFFHFVGALKPKDHCCYDTCGAVIHIETQAAQYGYADTLEIIKNSIKQYIPNDDITAADDKGDYPYPYVIQITLCI